MTLKIRLLFKQVLIWSVILCISLLIIEVVLDCVFRDRQNWLNQQLEPYYRWSFYTSAGEPISAVGGPLKLMFHPKVGDTNLPDQQHARFTINSRGFRGPEPLASTVDKVRIILIGGSTAFSTGSASDEDSFAQQLQQQLRDSFPNVEVINAAVIGYRSGQELSYLLHEMIDYNPDLIIALNGFNDFSVLLWNPQDPWKDFNGGEQTESQLREHYLTTQYNFSDGLMNILRAMFPRIYERVMMPWKNGTKAHPSENSSKMVNGHSLCLKDEVITTYTRNILKMRSLAYTNSSHLLVVLQPVRDI
jgi:hypothetical protein